MPVLKWALFQVPFTTLQYSTVQYMLCVGCGLGLGPEKSLLIVLGACVHLEEKAKSVGVPVIYNMVRGCHTIKPIRLPAGSIKLLRVCVGRLNCKVIAGQIYARYFSPLPIMRD